MRILPPYLYAESPTSRTGFVVAGAPTDHMHFRDVRRDETGEYPLTPWIGYASIARFQGHGKDGRRDVVSPKTFDQAARCPTEELYALTDREKAWSYLSDRPKEDRNAPPGAERAEGPNVSKPDIYAFMNVVLVNNPEYPEQNVYLGMFPKGALNSVLAIANEININAPQDQLERDPLLQFNYSSMLDPRQGIVFACSKGTDKGTFSSYNITAASANGRVFRRELQLSHLPQRYDLLHPETWLVPLTFEEIVTKVFPQLYNSRSPNGVHEWHALHEAFPELSDSLPTPPKAPAASSTVGGFQGFGGPQAAAPHFATPTQQFMPPAAIGGAPAFAGGYQSGQPAAPQGFQPPQSFAPLAAPGAQAPAQFPPPAAPQGFQPQQPFAPPAAPAVQSPAQFAPPAAPAAQQGFQPPQSFAPPAAPGAPAAPAQQGFQPPQSFAPPAAPVAQAPAQFAPPAAPQSFGPPAAAQGFQPPQSFAPPAAPAAHVTPPPVAGTDTAPFDQSDFLRSLQPK